ncbi:alpha/beta fold hydrolase [Amycolatopsis sp. CA-128772]|uniref:alpha/beta fold hydrolase n=1 Tax=Amycolatopsis sp. CA-128772 TaxID=2073159 RepID=UPI000CD1629A|nr:alpha/beta fold hydrolase [Amycolatopsis sp. CA-128772]
MKKKTVSRFLATAVLLAVPAVPAGTAAAATPDRYTGQQVAWGACPFPVAAGAKPAECAVITVPRDWADPDSGVDLSVSISRVAATGERLGALLVNPGGPGGQGSSLAGALAGLEPSVNERYDFIGMDPRGTGHEGTADAGFVCQVPAGRLPQGPLDARDRSAASIAEHRKTPRAVAEACQSDAVAPFVTTWQTAHDMDLIRTLLGDEKLNYLGYSYGTWLGAKYASVFPGHAGKVVLDSSVDFEGRLQAAFEAFPKIGQRQTDEVFVPWLARQFPGQLGASPAEVKQKIERLRGFYAGLGVAPDQFDALFVGNGNEIRWILVAVALVAGAGELDGKPVQPPASLAGQLDTWSTAVFGKRLGQLTGADVAAGLAAAEPDYRKVSGTRYAVACGDQPARTADWYKRLSDRQGPQYPIFGWAYGLTEPCGFWSDLPRQPLAGLPPEVAGNVLVVQGEFDPQTGYEQARSAVRAAGVPLVSVDDAAFHGQYALGGNPCVDGMVNVFLVANSRPGSVTCPGVPLPGEDRVFPVAGPVTGSHAATVGAADTRDPALRTAVRRTIGELNDGR